ncbi:hypothetical protein [Phormidium sp. CCY1219]|uniref:hypothetical protein n=1 Tax=Phormidium sp. CCY1219 TaxID=2886104 RepID=UPI002D1E5F06|nr:hypothetical protein [Phormidium sp. CCY1219]MEB3827127.1 hypothetical protein [Phormidium sp. CCY1219]
MKYVKAEESDYPTCPHCEAKIMEVKFKDLFATSWLASRKLIFFCPSCSKVLGISDADRA